MKTTKRHISSVLLAIVTTLIINACSQDAPKAEMPEVSEENCMLENIKTIKDRPTREKFAALCLRRGDYAPTDTNKW